MNTMGTCSQTLLHSFRPTGRSFHHRMHHTCGVAAMPGSRRDTVSQRAAHSHTRRHTYSKSSKQALMLMRHTTTRHHVVNGSIDRNTATDMVNTVEDGPLWVSVTFRGVRMQVKKGSRLRTALLKSGVHGVTPHNGDARMINCRGLGTCGTCAVQISGDVEPSSWTIMETARLNFLPHAPPDNQRLRLACQVRCQGDLKVTKYNGFWGQGQEALPDLLPGGGGGGDDDGDKAGVLGVGRTPLGNLEYILDRDA